MSTTNTRTADEISHYRPTSCAVNDPTTPFHSLSLIPYYCQA